MPLPSWVLDRAAIECRIADSPWTAPGYRLVGKDFYTCVEPADRVADRGVLRWIRSYFPELFPVWRKQTYIAPNSTEMFVAVHLGLARYVRDPRGRRHIPYVEMPANAKHPMPNVLERIFEDKDHVTVLHMGGPGPYQALDMQKCLNLIETDEFRDSRPQHVIDEENDRRARDMAERQMASLKDEWDYRRKHLDKFAQKHLDAPGDTLEAYRRYRAMRQEMAQRARRIVSPRAFVEVKGV